MTKKVLAKKMMKKNSYYVPNQISVVEYQLNPKNLDYKSHDSNLCPSRLPLTQRIWKNIRWKKRQYMYELRNYVII